MKYSLQLKAMAIALLLLEANSEAQAQINYKISVPSGYLTKDYLALATDNIPNVGQYIAETRFELVLEQEHAENYVRSVFESVGIPVLNVTSAKHLTTFREKAGGNDCEAAELLCSNTSQTANSGGAGTTQELSAANQGCLGIEHQSSWYYLNVQTGGSLTLTISPNSGGDDYDFAVWGPFTAASAGANCPPTSAPVRCSYSSATGNTGLMIPYNGQSSSFGCGFLGLFPCNGLITSTNNPADNSEGVGGDKWVSNLTTNANEVYILLVDNFSNSGQPYNLSFGGTSVLGCTPVPLPVELVDFNVTKTSQGNSLNWTTLTEDRSNYFTVEWSTNPASGNWNEIANVPAQGHSQESHTYHTFHSTPPFGEINYYRLNLTDLDGSRTVYDTHLLSVNNLLDSKNVEHIYNMLGQEVSDNCKGVVIYCYSDGTTERVFK
ncbi:hypothetical protein [Fluviicola chungangensis]|uniref:T9SS type A sorting domain-containing protein n=1 Tax=Fluviicola chungangensis TaxID=2597671 RepID=A0A556MZ09_9FLAO|nr:hypothetical protein [Fluviicola chungangensis]TSJ45038.1 hypothetical protein FO442_10620 [Fluviicola chungangensis]